MNATIAMTRVNLHARRSSSNLAAMCRGDVGLSPAINSISNRLGCFLNASNSLSVIVIETVSKNVRHRVSKQRWRRR